MNFEQALRAVLAEQYGITPDKISLKRQTVLTWGNVCAAFERMQKQTN